MERSLFLTYDEQERMLLEMDNVIIAKAMYDFGLPLSGDRIFDHGDGFVVFNDLESTTFFYEAVMLLFNSKLCVEFEDEETLRFSIYDPHIGRNQIFREFIDNLHYQDIFGNEISCECIEDELRFSLPLSSSMALHPYVIELIKAKKCLISKEEDFN